MKTPFFVFAAAAFLVLASGCATRKQSPEAVAVEAHETQPTVSPGTKFALLPGAVQDSIRARAGASEISDINKTQGEDGHDVYVITFRDHPTLHLADNGDPVNESNVGGVGAPAEIPEAGAGASPTTILPMAVQRTLQQAAPSAAVADVQRQRRTVYEITFQDPQRHPSLLIADDGTILRQPPY